MNKKELIFNEAARLFSVQGFNEVTVREIAAACEVSEGSLYVHFESKNQLLDEILDEFERKMNQYLLTEKQVNALIDKETPRSLLERCTVHFREEDEIFMLRAYRIVYMEQLTHPKARQLVLELMYDKTRESIRYLLDELMKRGKIPAFDAQKFSTLWAYFLNAIAALWMNTFYGGQEAEMCYKEFDEVAEMMIDMALCGKVPPGNS